ncbi:unnamed protein product [Orchesella dallaii]|uniref:Uncharacterized protein n=1 Tax=Orchesella dallaii TaxID=48710 RepID=A0ABP1RN62_9HEXA
MEAYNINDQHGGEEMLQMTDAEHFAILKRGYPIVVTERDKLIDENQHLRDELFQQMQQRDVSIQALQQRDAFITEFQQFHQALINEFQEYVLRSNKLISDQANKIRNLEDEKTLAISEAFKTWVENEKNVTQLQAKLNSVENERDEHKGEKEELKRQLEEKRAFDNVQSGIANSGQLPQQQVDTSVTNPTLMEVEDDDADDDDAADDDAAADDDENESHDSSSIGSKLSSLSESKSAELNDFEPMLHFVDVLASSNAGTYLCVCGKRFPAKVDRDLHLTEMGALAARKQTKLSATAGKKGPTANPTIESMTC